MSSTCKRFDVFDFKEEDELPSEISDRFHFKSKDPVALDKYAFLEKVACGANIKSKVVGDVPCMDVDVMENDQDCRDAVSCIPLEAGEECATKGMPVLDDDLQFNSTSHEGHPHIIPHKLKDISVFAPLETRASSPGTALPGNDQLDCSLLESPSSDVSVDAVSDAGESLNESSPSTSSDISENGVSLVGLPSDPYFGVCKTGNRNMTVAVCPDYVVYRDGYYTESVLTFSSSCINMMGLPSYGNYETFTFQWGLNDILGIKSQFFERLEIAMVKIHVMSKDAVQADSVHGTSGIEELKLAIVDRDWYKKQAEIRSLDVKYKAMWDVVFDINAGKDEDALPGQNGVHYPKSYFPNFDDSFEEVIYPKGDADAVSISKRDVDLLQPDTFVNDTIIDFYIKYLKNNIKPEERQRFHFFNSFFFRKLIDLDKDPSSAFESRAAFQRVRKWTRKVNLFEKDYIFIPVNFNYHWSLIVVCHPGEVAELKDEDVEKSLKVPCILHMDSIKGSHTGLKDLVQSYLWEEWKERQKETREDSSPKFSNLRFVPLELPQQQNSFDCGLFLLHYVELFLEEAPANFSPFKITKFSNFLNVDWFPPAEASLKRVLIQRLIYELLEGHSQDISLANCGEKYCSSDYPKSNTENETGVEFLSERCSPSKSSQDKLIASCASQGIEMTLLPTSFMRNNECDNDSGLVVREFFDPEATAGSFLDGQYQAFDRAASFNFKSALSPIEENVEASEHFVYTPSAEIGFQRLSGITPESCAFPYSSRGFGAETSWNPGMSGPQAGHEDIDSSPETSICASDNSLEVEVKENSPVREDLNGKERTYQPRSPSTGNIDCLTDGFVSASSEMLDVADSQYSDDMLDRNGNADPLTSSPNSPLGLSHEDCNILENGVAASDSARLIGDGSESDVQPDAKRLVDDASESDVQHDAKRLIGDGSESDVQQDAKRVVDDGSESDVQHDAKRLIDDGPESDVQQAAKRLRLTFSLEEDRELAGNMSKGSKFVNQV
ncbi:probable ubiquitin-like-specific protease 2B [Cornus florida]|uniref:probable ubiquitin-like-specific protease 2B n=1 Tax=Cornus florida TaxID=4283 RepID=UPI00289DEF19|nr:probable ubiquitin-like-specific protease 2B [Cornus florida]